MTATRYPDRVHLRFDNTELIDPNRLQVDIHIVQDCNGNLTLTFADGCEVETKTPPSIFDPRVRYKCSLLIDKRGEQRPKLHVGDLYEYYAAEQETSDLPDRVHKFKD